VCCTACYQNTALHTGCSVHRVVLLGTTFERRRYNALAALRCEGCNTIQGGYHHSGCAAEECPRCGRVMRRCRCQALRQLPGPPLAEPARELEFGRA
jgi:rRNA maturation endonuclease Nob1